MLWAEVRLRPLLKGFREVFGGTPVMEFCTYRTADSAGFALIGIVGKGGEIISINIPLTQVLRWAIGILTTVKAPFPNVKPAACHYGFAEFLLGMIAHNKKPFLYHY